MGNYSLTDLGTLSGNFPTARAINNADTIAGLLQPTEQPMRYKSSLQALPPGLGQAFGINNQTSEQIVGYVGHYWAFPKAALWTDGQFVNLADTFGLGKSQSVAHDINDSGVVVGRADDKAFRLDTSTQQVDILPLGNTKSWAGAINAQGNVVGVTYSPDFDYGQPFFYDGTTVQDIPVSGTLEFYPYPKLGINDSNTVVGGAQMSGGQTVHAFSYDPSTTQVTDLHPANFHSSVAWRIANNGVIVGHLGEESASPLAMIRTPTGGMQKLIDLVVNPSGWILQYATDINEEGHIIGTGTYFGQPRSFLLTEAPLFYKELDLPTLVAQVLIGLVHGGSGFIFLPGSGVVPVDPAPFRQWAALSPNEHDVLMGLAIHELASIVGDAEARRRIEVSGLETIKKAVDDLLTKAKGEAEQRATKK